MSRAHDTNLASHELKTCVSVVLRSVWWRCGGRMHVWHVWWWTREWRAAGDPSAVLFAQVDSRAIQYIPDPSSSWLVITDSSTNVTIRHGSLPAIKPNLYRQYIKICFVGLVFELIALCKESSSRQSLCSVITIKTEMYIRSLELRDLHIRQ
jgi:hypothetical protein